jgi:hypothetical protein
VDFQYLYLAAALACVIGGGLLYRVGGEHVPSARARTEQVGAGPVLVEPALAQPLLVDPGPPRDSPHDP